MSLSALLLTAAAAAAGVDTGTQVGAPGGDAPAPQAEALTQIPLLYRLPVDQIAVAIGTDGTLHRWTLLPAGRADAAGGVLLPAPADVVPADVHSVDHGNLRALDEASRGWLWRDECADMLEGVSVDPPAEEEPPPPSGCGCSGWPATHGRDSGAAALDSGPSAPADPDDFEVGAWRVRILQGVPAADAIAALEAGGFEMDMAAVEAVVQTLDAGLAIVAARHESGPQSALQVRMPTGLPAPAPLHTGLGVLGGAAERDVVVYGLAGSVAVGPLDEPLGMAPACLIDAEGRADLPAALDRALRVRQRARPQPVWEASVPDATQATALRPMVPSHTRNTLGARPGPMHLTRTRLRISRDDGDIRLPLGIVDDPPLTGGLRAVAWSWELARDVPRCDGAIADEGGTCFSAAWWLASAAGEPDTSPANTEDLSCGAEADARALLVLLPLAVAGLRRRR